MHTAFTILAKKEPATEAGILDALRHFGKIPTDYQSVVSEATELELGHGSNGYLRIWSPAGCVDMDIGYEIRKRIPSAFPFGDDGGGRFLCYCDGEQGGGVYVGSYGDIDRSSLVWVAKSLASLLERGEGLDRL